MMNFFPNQLASQQRTAHPYNNPTMDMLVGVMLQSLTELNSALAQLQRLGQDAPVGILFENENTGCDVNNKPSVARRMPTLSVEEENEDWCASVLPIVDALRAEATIINRCVEAFHAGGSSVQFVPPTKADNRLGCAVMDYDRTGVAFVRG